MPLADPDSDRRHAHLSGPAAAALLADSRRIVVVGARGWIGRTVIALLHDALGEPGFAGRVACFGSQDGVIEMDGFAVRQSSLSGLESLSPAPTLLLHLAFLTKDKVAGMDEAAYSAANRMLSDSVLAAIDRIGADRVFVASSGAAGFADDPAAAADLRLYGRLKRDDEDRFARWAESGPGRKVAIGRIFSVSGPWINKRETYALASFINDALEGREIAVRAPRPVYRSYVPVRELVSLVLVSLLCQRSRPEPVLRFQTGGEALELGDVASTVAQVLGGIAVRAPISQPEPNHYVGDDEGWRRLLSDAGMTPVPLVQQVEETAAFLARRQSAAASSGLAKDGAR